MYMPEGGGGQKEAPVGAGAPGSGTPRIVEGSIVRPAGQTHRRVEGGRQVDPQQPSGQSSSWFDQEMPYEELVGNIRGVVERARAKHPKNARKPFNPAAWLGWYLQGLAEREAVGKQRYGDVKTAWDALAYTYYPAEGGTQRDRELARWQLDGDRMVIELDTADPLEACPVRMTIRCACLGSRFSTH